ncbi:MAG: PepSY-associated TM helix domain-containing protein [Sinimarinibacterium flocculans]|uniref:PepSY-associated TM helix domain-containing protein n=1 Tax=Sinimarinibacterium flocculans TaxID=985250 RepID=UPI003C578086
MTANTPSRWFRINLWLHRWTSLVATIPFLILCITGTVLIFHEEIDHLLGHEPEAHDAVPEVQKPLAEAIDKVHTQFPDERVLSTSFDPIGHPGLQLIVTGPAQARTFDDAILRFVDLASGELVGETDPATTVTGFLLELHAQWFLGPVGELIGALMALLVLISLISGLVVYAPYVRRIAFGILRRGRGPRLLQLDLHNLIGAVVLGWAFVVTFTGFLLGFGTVALGIWQMTELAPMRAQADQMEPVDARQPPVDADRAFATATAGAPPGWHVISMIYPGTDFSTPRHYTALLAGTEGVDERMFRVVIIDAKTGEIALAPDVPWYLKAISLSEPLHFGDYGGMALKVLWTACTWLTLFITANGAWLWWDRRRRRTGRSEPAPTEGAVA